MENFLGQLKKYQITIDDLIVQNKELEAPGKSRGKRKTEECDGTGEAGKRIKGAAPLMERIPPELLAELRQEVKGRLKLINGICGCHKHRKEDAYGDEPKRYGITGRKGP